jgi:hypothetical protein
MDAQDNVVLRIYAEPPLDQPNLDWLSRPGATYFIKGDRAIYEVLEGRITMSSLPGRQPQLLLNVIDLGSAPQRQRMKADRFVLGTNTRPQRWYFDGQFESSPIRAGEPFDFVD